VFPNYVHAGNYSGVLHYLKAVRSWASAPPRPRPRAVAAMKRMPTDDDAYGPRLSREDGRKIHRATSTR
jgi:branched-chain amino acid transport system substrate-binding protein